MQQVNKQVPHPFPTANLPKSEPSRMRTWTLVAKSRYASSRACCTSSSGPSSCRRAGPGPAVAFWPSRWRLQSVVPFSAFMMAHSGRAAAPRTRPDPGGGRWDARFCSCTRRSPAWTVGEHEHEHKRVHGGDKRGERENHSPDVCCMLQVPLPPLHCSTASRTHASRDRGMLGLFHGSVWWPDVKDHLGFSMENRLLF